MSVSAPRQLPVACNGLLSRVSARTAAPRSSRHSRITLPSYNLQNDIHFGAPRCAWCIRRDASQQLRFRAEYSTTHTRRSGHGLATRPISEATGPRHEARPSALYELTRKELRQLVEDYPSSKNEYKKPGTIRFFNPLKGARPLMPSLKDKNPMHAPLAKRLTSLLSDVETPHEELIKTYNLFPEPRAKHIPLPLLHGLMHRLSVVPDHDEASMLRYLAVVDDMKAAGVPLLVSEWTSAIAFVGRCFKKISGVEVESALHTWREMEVHAGVEANEVTLNVLFDIATRSSKFTLAELIMHEMQQRGLRMNRYFRTGLIYYYGLKSDGIGVRRAYRDMVDAGEIIDNAVISCLIASLVKSGEIGAAEATFARMKRLHATKTRTIVPHANWRRLREIGSVLERAARHRTLDPEAYEDAKRTAPLQPTRFTYLPLVRYHAVESGNLERVSELVEEMHYYQIPPHGAVYYSLFDGFARHGGELYSPWTNERLEQTYTAFLAVVDDPERAPSNIELAGGLVNGCLRAFAKCRGDDRTREVWRELEMRWNPHSGDAVDVEDILRRVQWHKGLVRWKTP